VGDTLPSESGRDSDVDGLGAFVVTAALEKMLMPTVF